MSQSAGRQPILTGSLKQQNYPELHLKIQAVPRSKHTARALYNMSNSLPNPAGWRTAASRRNN